MKQPCTDVRTSFGRSNHVPLFILEGAGRNVLQSSAGWGGYRFYPTNGVHVRGPAFFADRRSEMIQPRDVIDMSTGHFFRGNIMAVCPWTAESRPSRPYASPIGAPSCPLRPLFFERERQEPAIPARESEALNSRRRRTGRINLRINENLVFDSVPQSLMHPGRYGRGPGIAPGIASGRSVDVGIDALNCFGRGDKEGWSVSL